MSVRERYLAVRVSSHEMGRYRLIRPANADERTDTLLNPREIVVLFQKENYKPVVSLIRGGSKNWVVDAFGMEVEHPKEFL